MLQMTLLVLQLLLVALSPLVVALGRMEVLYSWKQIDLNFLSSALRDDYISSGQFIPKNNVILDVDVWNGEFHNSTILPVTKNSNTVTLFSNCVIVLALFENLSISECTYNALHSLLYYLELMLFI